jgi:FkbM family methyltransferase
MHMPTFPRDISGILTKAILWILSKWGIRPARLYLPALRMVFNDPREISSTFNEIFVDQIYRPVRPLRRGCKIVDIGAHYGVFMIYAMMRLCPGEIRCLEPNPYSFEILRKNLAAARNRGEVPIEIKPVAVAAEDGQVRFLIPKKCTTSLGAKSLPRHQFVDASEDFINLEVRAITIERAIDSKCDFLKLDGEGIEYEILINEIFTPANVGEIAVEFHDIIDRREEFLHVVDTLCERKYGVFNAKGEPLGRDRVRDLGRCAESQNRVLHFA